MNVTVPLDVFKQVPHPVFAADEQGRVRFCNAAAASLLDCDTNSAIGRPCWELARFRTPGGGTLCRRTCAIQRQAVADRLPCCHLAVLSSGGAASRYIEISTVPLSPPLDGRRALLHLVTPVAAPSASAGHVVESGLRGEEPGGLGRLTSRERDVLHLLAAGRSTRQIAEGLAILPVTVRNHVESILRKLHVHRRVEAVLAWINDPR